MIRYNRKTGPNYGALVFGCLLYTSYFILCICLVGFSFGGLLVVFAPMVKIIFGSRFYNRNYGLIFIGYGIGAFVGPKISASFYDSTGSYVAGYIGSAILARCV